MNTGVEINYAVNPDYIWYSPYLYNYEAIIVKHYI